MSYPPTPLEFTPYIENLDHRNTIGYGFWAGERAVEPTGYADGGEDRSTEPSEAWTDQSAPLQQSSSKTQNSLITSQMSPPLTPRASRDVMPAAAVQSPELPSEPETTFHNYLRAFYPFHPTSTVSSTGDESSITVPINQGDVILVHSVHPNGWADGTLLASGARGWLPTNYCEPYEHPAIRNLLNALTLLWDLVRSNEHETFPVFSRQDYVRGMIAGVRVFLVSDALFLWQPTEVRWNRTNHLN
jgi:hypothetical protein